MSFFSPASLPLDEAERQAVLDALNVLDTVPTAEFEAMVADIAARFGVPIAAISLVDRNRQWFMAKVGLDATETPRAYSFCAHAPGEPDGVLVVPNAAEDERFRGNPLVTGDLHLRFYAGAVLQGEGGQPLGALCVIDREPRPPLTEEEREALKAAARAVSEALAKRRR